MQNEIINLQKKVAFRLDGVHFQYSSVEILHIECMLSALHFLPQLNLSLKIRRIGS